MRTYGQVKRFPFFIMIMILVIGPSSCFLFECPDALDYFRIDGIKVNIKLLSKDYSSPLGDIPKNGEIEYENHVIRVDFSSTYYSENYFSSGSFLYARKCAEDGHSGTEIGVDTIYVITMTDYNSTYLANDTINKVISIDGFDDRPTISDLKYFTTLSEYLTYHDERIRREFCNIRLEQTPRLTTDLFQFKVIYILEDGKTFEGQTNKIKFKL